MQTRTLSPPPPHKSMIKKRKRERGSKCTRQLFIVEDKGGKVGKPQLSICCSKLWVSMLSEKYKKY